MFPKDFESSIFSALGETDGKKLLDALDGEAVTSIRFNPFKLSEKPEGDGVPWNRYGFYLAERPVFTLDPLMHGGAYYVQEASSQFVEHLYRQTMGEAEGVRLLDLCAAPGGKTTLYSTLTGAGGLVVANEVIKQRASVLADNVRRWGIGNVAVSCNDAANFAAYKHWFDVLAVDAPCSGEGMFRKNKEARTEWSPANVEMCAARQRRILADAWDTLRPGGVLIYSTCTFNTRENEGNVAWLAENYAVEPVEIDVPAEWGIECGTVDINLSSERRSGKACEDLKPQHTDEYVRISNHSGNEASPSLSRQIQTFRFWPHRLRGEGFFAAVMRKADGKIKRETPKSKKQPLIDLNRNENRPLTEWVAQPEFMKFAKAGDNCYAFYRAQYPAVAALAEGLNIIYSGVCMGQLFNAKLRPDHALALFHDLNKDNTTCTELPLNAALDYLRKQEFRDVSALAEGLNLLTFAGLPIGWTKRIGHRTNTMLPNSFRIVNL